MKFCPLQVFALLLLPLLAACSGLPAEPTTNMTYDRQFDFAGVHTVYIEPLSRTDAGSVMVSDAQIRRIDDALVSELQRRGFEVASASEQADLLLHWYLVTSDPVKVDSGDCDGCDMVVDGGARYSRGTLVVDMVDPMRNRAVWRSVLKTELTAEPDSAGADQARREAAAAIFAKFPPQ